MKSGTITVFKKELARFFGDKRLLFTAVIMPGLLIYLIYSVMGNSINSMMEEKTSSYRAAAVNMPQSVASQLAELNFEIDNISADETDGAKERIGAGEYAICAVFPENFESTLAAYAEGERSENTMNVGIYYNSADINSSAAFEQLLLVLNGVENQVSNVFDVNMSVDGEKYDLATEKDSTGMMLSMILPMLIMTMLFSSCTAVAPESIAGEKERGTIAALLITPVPRSQIILGKVLALSVISLLGGMSSFLGTLLSVPTLMQGMGDEAETIRADVYGAKEYICLILLILTAVLLLITLISVISAFAKSVKEAGTMVMPLMIVVMVTSVLAMYQSEPKAELYWYIIPIYNTIESMTQVFSFSANLVNIAVTTAANIIFSAAGIFVLTKMFNSEKIMFNQ